MRSTNSDICQHVTNIGCSPFHYDQDYTCNGWFIVGEAVPCGDNSKLLCDEYAKIIDNVCYVVRLINTSEHSSVGGDNCVIFSIDDGDFADLLSSVDDNDYIDPSDFDGVSFAGSLESVREFLNDFDCISEIVDMASVKQTL